MKPPQKSLAEIREERQKVLDKRSRLLYNIRKRFGGIKDMDLINNPQISQDLNVSKAMGERLQEIGKAVKAVSERPFFNAGRSPIIAGGAVRDMVFGLRAKDVDVFMDISKYDEDVQDDVVLLFAHSLMKEMNLDTHTVANVTAETDYNGRPGFESSFVVYEIQRDWGLVDALGFAEQEDEEDFVIDALEVEELGFIPIQIIGRKDPTIETDMMKFLEDFDYGLVRGLLDPEDQQFKFHPSFAEQLGMKNIEFSDPRTYARLHSWKQRWSLYEKKFPFILYDVTTKKMSRQLSSEYIAKTMTMNWDVEGMARIHNAERGGLLNAIAGDQWQRLQPIAEQQVAAINRVVPQHGEWIQFNNQQWRVIDPPAQEPLQVREWRGEIFEQQVAEQERDPFDEANF